MKMCNIKILMILLPAFFLSMGASVCAQVKIGNHPTTINKASLLELESDSLGLLLPRLKDTVTINSLNPPDGMMIYLIDASAKQHLYIRKYGSWSDMGNSSGFNLSTGLKSDSVVTTLNGVLRKMSMDSMIANGINNNTTLITNVINNTSSFNLTNGLKSDSVVTTLNGALRKVRMDSLVANSITNNTTLVTNVINNASTFNLTNGLKSDSVVTTLNGALRKVRMDSLVANSITNNTTLVTNVINNASSFNLANGLKTDSVVTTLNGALRKVSVDSLVTTTVNKSSNFNLTNGLQTDSVVTTLNGALRKVAVDSLINNSVKRASGYAEPIQVIQAATGSAVFSPATTFTGGVVSFADNEVKKFVFSVPGVKPGDVVMANAAYGVSDALFIAKSLVSAADTVEITIINGTPVAVSSSVQMSIGLIRK